MRTFFYNFFFFWTTQILYKKGNANLYTNDISFLSHITQYLTFYILAIFSGKGVSKYEIGIAVIDLHYPHLILCQISDDYLYSNTIAKVNIYQPNEIIVPQFCRNEVKIESFLHDTIAQAFNKMNLTCIPRSHFCASTGWDLLHIYGTEDSSSGRQMIENK